jgi:hypothetical protein
MYWHGQKLWENNICLEDNKPILDVHERIPKLKAWVEKLNERESCGSSNQFWIMKE